jgi:hypothetical protein
MRRLPVELWFSCSLVVESIVGSTWNSLVPNHVDFERQRKVDCRMSTLFVRELITEIGVI